MIRLQKGLLALVLLAAGCDGDGGTDAGVDAGDDRMDAGDRDAGRRDAGTPDAGDPCEELTAPAVTTEELVPGHGWTRPVFLTQPAGVEDLFVVEQNGTVQRVAPDGTVTEFLDVSDRVECCGERGLLGLAFHPDYTSNGRFFVYYTDADNVVAEYARSDADPQVADDTEVARLVVIDDPEPNHNGGMITFGPDGYLYVGTGDGGGGGDRHGDIGNGLSRDTLMGKILRLDVDAAGRDYAPDDNPFVGGDGLPQIWAYGLRNPWRFSFDRLTGDLWIGDVGQNEWEEIDFQSADSAGGENYGWRAYEGDTVFSPDDVDQVPEHAEPIHVFAHNTDETLPGACSVTGGYVYRGGDIPGLRGFYVFGDYCSSQRAALKRCPDGTVAGLQRLEGLNGAGGNVFSFAEDRGGELYILGDTVLRIVAE